MGFSQAVVRKILVEMYIGQGLEYQFKIEDVVELADGGVTGEDGRELFFCLLEVGVWF